jgi:hypothetical protein
MPAVLSLVSRLGALGPLMFRTISQTRISYRGSPLSEGHWGRLAAGDRLAWLKGQDNHAVLNFTWQVHVHGEAGPELRAWAKARGLPLHVWPWGAEAEAVELRRDGAVLVRPDGHVGCLSHGAGAPAVLEAYARRCGLPFGSVSNRTSPR